MKRITEKVLKTSDEQDLQIAEDERQRKILLRQDRINDLIENSGLSPRFKSRTLDNYEAQLPGQRTALEAACWFVHYWRETPGLLFLGNTGTGKNHLCAGIVNSLITKSLATVLVTEPIKMIRRVKESWRREGELESQVLKGFREPDLLVIDEIGVQFGSSTEMMYLTEIINDRYNWLKPTIIAGNVSLSELKTIIGERAVERFREGGKMVVFDWESYRGKKP